MNLCPARTYVWSRQQLWQHSPGPSCRLLWLCPPPPHQHRIPWRSLMPLWSQLLTHLCQPLLWFPLLPLQEMRLQDIMLTMMHERPPGQTPPTRARLPRSASCTTRTRHTRAP